MKLLCLLLLALAELPASDRRELELAYLKVERAAAYKYIDGMLSYRDFGFQAHRHDGKRVDLAKERALLESAIGQAIQVEDAITLESLRPEGQLIRCRVVEKLTLRYPPRNLLGEWRGASRALEPERTIVWTSQGDDFWQRSERGWRCIRSQRSWRARGPSSRS